MDPDEQEDQTVYNVVCNDEQQYSIWPANEELPLGWREVGKQGLKPDCLSYIEAVWTDILPACVRTALEASRSETRPLFPVEKPSLVGPASDPPEDHLVLRLCKGEHPVEVCLR